MVGPNPAPGLSAAVAKGSGCRRELALGLPALDMGLYEGAVPEIVGTNHRLLNCSAKPPSPNLQRLCVCADGR